MPLSASFHFFSPLRSKKKYHINFLPSFILYSFYSILLSSLYHIPYLLLSVSSFIGYIRNLALAN